MVILLLACVTSTPDTGADTADSGAPEEVSLDGACADDVRWGSFSVESWEDYAYAAGSVADGVVPASILTEVITTGDCTIWRRENPFCDPSCDLESTCDFDGTCIPYPETRTVGVVSVDGLVQDVAMSPVPPGHTYFDTSLPNPPWAEGDLLTLTTGGGDYEAVTMHGYAPVALSLPSIDWVVVSGEALPVTWDAPATAVQTRVDLTLRIDQHGTTPSRVACSFEDDGAAEVPADVLAELTRLGVSGFPEGQLIRRTVDSAPIGGGCVEFGATSSRLMNVSIEGYTPCTNDQQCPDGQTCNESMERCE